MFLIVKKGSGWLFLAPVRMSTPQSRINVGELFMVMIISVIGLALSPVIAGSVKSAVNNFTGSAKTILELFPLLWVVLMVAIPIAYIAFWFKEK